MRGGGVHNFETNSRQYAKIEQLIYIASYSVQKSIPSALNLEPTKILLNHVKTKNVNKNIMTKTIYRSRQCELE